MHSRLEKHPQAELNSQKAPADAIVAAYNRKPEDTRLCGGDENTTYPSFINTQTRI